MQIRPIAAQDRINHFVNQCGATRQEAMMLVVVELERDLAGLNEDITGLRLRNSELERDYDETKLNLSHVAAAMDMSIEESFYEIKAMCVGNTAYSSC